MFIFIGEGTNSSASVWGNVDFNLNWSVVTNWFWSSDWGLQRAYDDCGCLG